jgi:hypothetical protein
MKRRPRHLIQSDAAAALPDKDHADNKLGLIESG